MTDTQMEETEPSSSTAASTPASASAADVGRSQSQKQRRQQVAIACVRCRRRKIRCNGRFPCDPCLRLRQTCQEPEVKRAPSRASLGRRIEQLEALASEAGIDIFGKPGQQQQQQQQQQEGAGPAIHVHSPPAVEGNRNRSLSAASASSNLSLPSSLPQRDTSDLLPPPNNNNNNNNSGQSPMAQSPGPAALSPLDIPMIEVTASSRRQSPDPWGNPYPSPGSHTPELATPALSTGSLSVPPSPALAQPWMDQANLPPQHDAFLGGNPLSLEPDAFSLSRRSSVSSHGVHHHMGHEAAGLASSTHLSVDPAARKPHLAVPQPQPPDMLSAFAPTFPNEIYGDVDISNLSMGQQPQMASSPAADAGVSAFSAHSANLCSSAYFERVHPFFPFLDDHETYLAYERAVYHNEPLDSMSTGAYFQVYIVQAIGARILEYQHGIQKSFRESYFYAALLCHNSFHKLETLQEVQSALLLLLYSIYCDAPQIQPQRLKATITSSCVQLGLHETRHDKTPLSPQANCELRTFLSAYTLDRSLSLAHGQPFSLSDDDIEIETLVSQLAQNTSHPHPQPEARRQSSYSPTTAPVLAATAKLSRILSTIHTVYSHSRPHNTHGIPRLSTPFLTTATPTTLSRWRGEIFRTLEKLTAEVRQLRDVAPAQNTLSLSVSGGMGSDSSPLTIPDLVEAQINECILFLLHPPPAISSSSPTSPASEGMGNVSLNPFEAAAMQSTARSTASIYRRMQDAKTLLPSAPFARGLYLTGTTLLSCLGAQTGSAGGGAGGNTASSSQGESKKGGSASRKGRRESNPSKGWSGNLSPAPPGARADDPDVLLCTGILHWLADEGVDIARVFAEELERG